MEGRGKRGGKRRARDNGVESIFSILYRQQQRKPLESKFLPPEIRKNHDWSSRKIFIQMLLYSLFLILLGLHMDNILSKFYFLCILPFDFLFRFDLLISIPKFHFSLTYLHNSFLGLLFVPLVLYIIFPD